MTERTHKGSFEPVKVTPVQLARRVEKWKERLEKLGVAHFRINAVHIVDETPGGQHAEASVQVSESYDNATFWFTWEFLDDCDEYALDVTIVHEWMHVAMRDWDRSLECVETWMPKATYADFEDRMGHEREKLVERMARTIVGLYYNTDR